ncbi:valine--tRNA ligase [Chloroflexia bacterium SDU3-3]|nr:valine--tRNA ligase [Chloroflexia bacterium SDU3-3]
MDIPQSYRPEEAEPRMQRRWAEQGTYHFNPTDRRPIFAIDTPPPTVSGALHIGHVYSYIQAEAMVRYRRMRGYAIYYPFGFDDNGLPTERYVEKTHGIAARDVGREAFTEACLSTTREVEARFEAFWQRLGISADWRLRYSTIDERARRTSQWSFLDLYRRGRIYRAQAPGPWCCTCGTAIAQAEIDDIERDTVFSTLCFALAEGDGTVEIATTRPELLPACVAIFVHPEDARFQHLVGRMATVPLLGHAVPILAEPTVEREKGSGAVMCCTFGDTADVAWWQAHGLPLIPLVGRDGRLGAHGGAYAGLTLAQARRQILADLGEAGALLGQRPARQSIRVHERCGTPLEILESSQWFIRVLDMKDELLAAGRAIAWHPEHMRARYEHWVENLGWDWCISRQRFFGVPFPLWRCASCGQVVLADEAQLPVDPLRAAPPRPCPCGGPLEPDPDVMDTWATSSVSPQIAGQLLDQPELFGRLFPMALRPQAHDIIRTWAFDTIVKSLLHHGQIPWRTLLVSGHVLTPRHEKLSKSKGNASADPDALIARYGADAIRYWACSGGTGADQLFDEDVIRRGAKLVNKLWNAARLIGRAEPRGVAAAPPTPLDRAMLSWLQRLIQQATASMEAYSYTAALDATERFFWSSLCDNYLELAKGRLYDGDEAERERVALTLRELLGTLLRLLAPFLPHITEEIYVQLYAAEGESIHTGGWPEADPGQIDEESERAGEAVMAILAQARRWKSERRLGLATPLASITAGAPAALHPALAACEADIRSGTRAARVALAVASSPQLLAAD